MNIFNQLPCPAIMTDRNGVILEANSALYQLLGLSSGTLSGQRLEQFVTKASYIIVQSHVWPTLFKEERISEVFIHVKDASGTVLPAYLNVNTVENCDERHYCWVFFIAKERAEFERKLIDMREQLKQTNSDLDSKNQALRNANAELEQFSYMASHDLKEPVRTLNTFATYLIDDVKAGNHKRVAQDIDYIKAASLRMSALISDLLEYSKAGNSEISKSEIRVQDILSDVENRLLTQIQETGTTIEVDLNAEYIFGDYLSLSLVVQNLLQNAMKFRKDDVPLKIHISSCNVAQRGVNLEISDNGIGIAENMQAHIFDPFKKLHSSNEYPGTGIGLAIVAKIIKRHEGIIQVRSSLSKGACFTISLPNLQIE